MLRRPQRGAAGRGAPAQRQGRVRERVLAQLRAVHVRGHPAALAHPRGAHPVARAAAPAPARAGQAGPERAAAHLCAAAGGTAVRLLQVSLDRSAAKR